MTTAVYIVGGPTDDDRDDLRHSLRSLAENAPFVTEVWCVGDVPAWFAGVALPLPPKADKFANQRASITAFVNYPGAPSTFALMNDDMYVTEPITAFETYRNANKASTWAEAEKAGGRRLNGWHRTVLASAAVIEDWTGRDPFIYETHTPLMLDTAKLAGAVNAYPMGSPFAVSQLYNLAGIGGEGKVAGNAKVRPEDDLDAKMAQDMPYLSGNPVTWKGAFGEYVRGRWTEPCRWER